MPSSPNHPDTEESNPNPNPKPNPKPNPNPNLNLNLNLNRYHQQEVNHSDRRAVAGSFPGQGSALSSVEWRRAQQAPRDLSE
eukprot:g21946.t1